MMKTTNQSLEQLTNELNKLEAQKTCAVKGGCCGPGKNGHHGNGNGNGNGNGG